MSDYLYLDIETIPTNDASIMAEIAATVTMPKSITKPESIAAWEKDTKPGLVAEAVAKTSFSGALGQICCISFAWNDARPASCTRGIRGMDEADMLKEVAGHFNDTRPTMEQPIVVGHYVAGFDIRFIWQRAFVLGVTLPYWFPRDPRPWSNQVHDTMNMWAGAKDTISLDNLCKALGLPGKSGIGGSMVAGMWQRGEYDAIASYCRDDVERVRRVHRKMLVAMGEVA